MTERTITLIANVDAVIVDFCDESGSGSPDCRVRLSVCLSTRVFKSSYTYNFSELVLGSSQAQPKLDLSYPFWRKKIKVFMVFATDL